MILFLVFFSDEELDVSTFEEFTDEFTLPNSLPPGDDVSILKKDFQEETFQITSNSLFEFNDSFKSSNVNPLFEENDKDVEIKFSSSITLTSPQGNVSIPPGIDLTIPSIFEVSSSNPTSPTLTGEKVWICQILQEISQKRTRERMSDQEAKELKAKPERFMPQPSTVNCS
ncbi:hypothetical protein Tco_1473704 [Tanacetum coccineum]